MLENNTPSTIHRVSLIVPTLNAGKPWADFILALQSQILSFEGQTSHNDSFLVEVTVVDSSSSDDTVVLAKDAGFKVLVIDKRSFDHGGTRQLAFEHILKKSKQGSIDLKYQWVVFMTQDAILSDPLSLTQLLSGFKNEQVGACYGRQLPHPCLLYTSPSPRDRQKSRMPSSA